MTHKIFKTVDVLGCYTGILLRQGGFSEIHEIIEFIVGHPVFTHQLADKRYRNACREHLETLFPGLTGLSKPPTGDRFEPEISNWLADAEIMFGSEMKLTPLAASGHLQREPIREAEELVGKDRVVVVEV